MKAPAEKGPHTTGRDLVRLDRLPFARCPGREAGGRARRESRPRGRGATLRLRRRGDRVVLGRSPEAQSLRGVGCASPRAARWSS